MTDFTDVTDAASIDVSRGFKFSCYDEVQVFCRRHVAEARSSSRILHLLTLKFAFCFIFALLGLTLCPNQLR